MDLNDVSNLDPRCKRIIFRSQHRGMREVDILLGTYVESIINDIDEEGLIQLEDLIEQDDQAILSCIAGGDAPPELDTPIFKALKAFHTHDKPLDL